ncbi:MAG: TonB-dependent receptor [Candidatus Eremiobacteraeota bacterium]|nr:TonB-dependent receptor [Candidatus Eremiobacteraeota bacterium]MBC5826426.1 TonB-dependent receptor [Candidatus Eremiobacteraeota bacterium]
MQRRAIQATRCLIGLVFGAIIACGAPGIAGTTGGISGRVVDAETKVPIPGTRVEVRAGSGSAESLTDAKGIYTFVSLSPDTYTLFASRAGYQPFSQGGVTVQADVHQVVNVSLISAIRTIGRVITRPRSGLVRPGQTIDVYSITPDTAKAAQPLAGPGGVDQAYGALAVVPGVYVPQGQQGWYQPIFIRGGDQDQIGYELDGVPVNRSYDNAPQSLLTGIGQQELQVYTGGATASSDGQGISGYVNQVVKTGSKTPFGSLTYGFGFPAGYQKAGAEYGGGTHDGRLTYYIAASLADQYYRYVDPFNGTSLNRSGFFFPSFQFTSSGNPIDLPGITLGASETRDREAIANLHYLLPHRRDKGSDDLQLLHVESDLNTFTYGSFLDFGGKSTFGTIFAYPDQYIYTGPIGAVLNPSAVSQYLYPDTPDAGRSYQSAVNGTLRAVADNGFSLTKLQYQRNFGTRAYLRFVGFGSYRGTLGQFENILLDASGNQSGVNIGSERSIGVEFAFQKGDFERDGVSGLVAFTYNHSRFRYAKFASGFNALDLINHQISRYNAYTAACAAGGSAAGATQFGSPLCGSTSAGSTAGPCFTPGGTPESCAAGDVVNPYWNRSPQALLDPNGDYVPYDIIPDQPLQAGNGFGQPITATVIGQYKRRRFTVTPSVTYSSGAFYGAPLSTVGDDPATNNTSTIPIPNNFTGKFDNMGAFQQPWRLTGNLQLGYAVTRRMQLSAAMTGLFDACHQRGYAWDRPNFCTYTTLPFGVAPNSSAHVSATGDANYEFPYTVQNGNNNTQYLGTKIPFQTYVTLQVKM